VDLAEGFVEGDARGGGEVQAAGLGVHHGDADEAVGVGLDQGRGQAFGLTAKNEHVPVLELGVPKGAGVVAGLDEKKALGDQARGEGLPGGVDLNDGLVQVVEAGAAEQGFVHAEAERFNEMKAGVGDGAKAGDVSGVGRDFGMDKHHVEHPKESRAWSGGAG
jgi:hypothetical protein